MSAERLLQLQGNRIEWTSDTGNGELPRLASDWAQEFPDEAAELAALEDQANHVTATT